MIKKAKRWGVYGASGSGKSTYVKRMLRQKSRKRVLVFDPQEEYAREVPGFVGVSSLRDLVEKVAKSPGAFKIAFTPPRTMSRADALDKLSDFALHIQADYIAGKSKDQLTLVAEELNTGFRLHQGPTKAPAFAELCSRGRHAGVEIIGIAQRIAEIDTQFRGNLSAAVVFRQFDENDIKAAKLALGRRASIDMVEGLKTHEFIEVDAETGDLTRGKNRLYSRA